MDLISSGTEIAQLRFDHAVTVLCGPQKSRERMQVSDRFSIALDIADGLDRPPSFSSHYRVEAGAFFFHTARAVRFQVVAEVIALMSLFAAVWVWLIGSGDTPPLLGQVPVPMLVMPLAGVPVWCLVALVHRWNPVEQEFMFLHGRSVFRLGASPFGPRMLLVGPEALVVLDRTGTVIAHWSRTSISAVAISPGRATVAFVLAVDDEFSELSTSLSSAGPVSRAWSLEGMFHTPWVAERLEAELADNNYPHARVDGHQVRVAETRVQ